MFLTDADIVQNIKFFVSWLGVKVFVDNGKAELPEVPEVVSLRKQRIGLRTSRNAVA